MIRTAQTARAKVRAHSGRAAAVTVEAIERRVLLSAEMIADLDPTTASSFPGAISDGGGGNVFFAAGPADANNAQVYRSDGTAAGTVPLPGVTGATASLLAAGTKLYRLAAGGFLIGTYNLASPATSPPRLTGSALAVRADNSIIYAANGTPTPDGEKGLELWGSNGLFKDINPGGASSSPADLLTVGNLTYFSADDGTSGRELWRSDGTVAGTTRLKDIFPGTFGSKPYGFANLNETLYFFASDGTGGGAQLWKSDGTEAGTVPVVTIASGPAPVNVSRVTVAGGRMFFTAYDDAEVWTSDGTAAGTVRLVQVGSPDKTVAGLVATSAGTAYFKVKPAVGGSAELWRSDATPAGTAKVATFPIVESLTTPASGDAVYFRGGADDELWKSDGTPGGTVKVADINPGGGSSITSLTRVGSLFYFSADDGIHGAELWKSDGTAAGTSLVADVNIANYATGASGLVPFRGSVFYDYSSPNAEFAGLWRTDGTAIGTSRVLAGGGGRIGMNVLNGKLFWAEPVGSAGSYSFRSSDGTAAGTTTIGSAVNPANFTLSGDGHTLYFTARTTANGPELWKTDGTLAGTAMVKDIEPGTGGSDPAVLTMVGDTLFFYARTTASGYELWKSDGTAAGTVMVKEIVPGSVGIDFAEPGAMVNVRGTVFFYAANTGASILWKSDGTGQGTVPVDLGTTFFYPESYYASTRALAALGTSVYFVAADQPGTFGTRYLYRTDGTAAGLVRLNAVDIVDQTPPFGMVTLDDSIYFWNASSAGSKWDLWKATSVGATLVRQLAKTTDVPRPGPFVKVGGLVYAAAPLVNDGAMELLQTDGTSAGTSVQDINPIGQSGPAYLTPAYGDSLFFVADDGVHGREVWRVAPTKIVAPPATVTELSATAVDAGRVNLVWKDVADETGYRVERSSSQTFATVDQAFYLLADTTSFTDTTTVGSTTYYYRVIAYNTGGDAPAPFQTASAVTPSTPIAPSNLRVLQSTEPTGRRLNLSWTDNSTNETSFRLERSLSVNFATIEQTFTVPADSTTFTDTTGLTPQTVYFYRILAVNASGDSLPATASGFTNPAPSPAPTGLVAWGSSPTRVELQWNDVETFKFNWVIERSDNGGPFQLIATPQAVTPPRYSDTTVRTGNTYAYRVKTPGQQTDYSNVATAAPGPSVSPALVTDVNAKLVATGSDPSAIVVSSGIGYFAATTNDAGRELWRTDGTAAGTYRAADIVPGAGNSNPSNLSDINGTLYFAAVDSTGKNALWKSDGTAAGTILVKSISLFTFGDVPFVKAGSYFYFAAAAATSASPWGTELWKSDGTTAGTSMVKDIWVGPDSSQPMGLTAFGDRVIFTAATGVMFNREPWISDGTAGGTYQLADINDADKSVQSAFVAVGSNVYFNGAGAASGPELWKTDGTLAGTGLVKDIWAEQNFGSAPRDLIAYHGLLYFTAEDREHNRSLWRSDGTAEGTVLVKDFVEPITGGQGSEFKTSLAVAGDTLFARIMQDNNVTSKLYAGDGTDGGMQAVFTLPVVGTAEMIVAGNRVYGLSGLSLWESDGTTAGSTTVATLPASGTFGTLSAFGAGVLFNAGDESGKELWRSDGTAAGTFRLKDVNSVTQDALPQQLTPAGAGLLYFVATGTDGVRGLYRTDGTAANTTRVAVGTVTSIAATSAGDGSVFFASNDAGVFRLWTVGVGAASATLVSDAFVKPLGKLYIVGSRAFFLTRGSDNALQLWTSDGTATGTVQVPGAAPADPTTFSYAEPIPAGGYLYFVGTSPDAGDELWRTDGTAAGTSMVFDAKPGTGSGGLDSVTAIGSRVYFVASGPASGWTLWRTDGTPQTTAVVKDQFGSAITSLTPSAGILYFAAPGGPIWRSDGTTAGTVPLPVAGLSTTTPAVSSFTDAGGGIVFFAANDAARGIGLYRSDGTAAGTVRVKDLSTRGPQPIWSGGGGTVFFTEANAYWRSDGTTAGTLYVSQISPGTTSTEAGEVAIESGRAYFRSSDGMSGRELWKVDLAVAPAVSSITVGNGSAQRSQVRSLTVTFDRAVTLGAGAVTLQMLNAGGSGANDGSAPTDASAALAAPTTPDDGKTWIYTFAAASSFVDKTSTGLPTGSLVDGIYRLSVDPTKVTANGVAMAAAPAPLTFHRLFGDVDGTKSVNNADFGAFRNSFGKLGTDAAFNPAFDFDNNGTINNADFGQFRNRFLKSLSY